MPDPVTRTRHQTRKDAIERARRWREEHHGWVVGEAEASLLSAFALGDLLRALNGDAQ